MPEELFKHEKAYFEKHKPGLLKSAPGKFALIKGDELIGTYDTEDSAYEAGVQTVGIVPFFIVRIVPITEIERIPSLYLGLLNAHV